MGLSRRLSATKICGVLLVALSAVMACSGGGDDEGGAASGSVWAPTTVAFDPACEGCEEIGTFTLAHAGEAKLLVDKRVDDPVSQWARCVNGVLDCIEKTKDESACVAGSSCPAACKDDYRAHLSGLGRTDLKARWTALKAVFVAPTSRCAITTFPEVAP